MKRYLRNYTNKVIIVVGGTSGMGKATVRLLEPVAKTIICIGRNEHEGERIIAESNGNVVFHKIEMKQDNEVDRVFNDISDRYGPIDCFFNFAGTFLAGEIRDTPVEDWHAIYASNTQPILNGTATMYKIMRKQGKGHIINVASAAGLFPVPIMSIYGSTKSAVVSLTQALRMEAGAFGVKASVACPTVVNTPLYDTARFDGVNKRKALTLVKGKTIQTAEVAAERILKGVARNKAVIHTAYSTKFGWMLYRFSPSLYMLFSNRFFALYRNSYRKK